MSKSLHQLIGESLGFGVDQDETGWLATGPDHHRMSRDRCPLGWESPEVAIEYGWPDFTGSLNAAWEWIIPAIHARGWDINIELFRIRDVPIFQCRVQICDAGGRGSGNSYGPYQLLAQCICVAWIGSLHRDDGEVDDAETE